MKSLLVLLLLFLSATAFSPDREFSETYYLYFENDIADGVCDFKLPIEDISTQKLDSLKAFDGPYPYIFSMFGEYYHFMYDGKRKGYVSLRLPFMSQCKVKPIHIFNNEDPRVKTSGYILSGYTNIYGSGGGMRFGGTVMYSFTYGEDSIRVHLKLRDYVSDESFGRHGSKRYFNSYKRPIFSENGEVYILPIDSFQLDRIYDGKRYMSPMVAGVYHYKNDSLRLTNKITIE